MPEICYKVVFDRKSYSVTLTSGSNTRSNLPSSETTRIKIVIIDIYIYTDTQHQRTLTSLTINSSLAVNSFVNAF